MAGQTQITAQPEIEAPATFTTQPLRPKATVTQGQTTKQPIYSTADEIIANTQLPASADEVAGFLRSTQDNILAAQPALEGEIFQGNSEFEAYKAETGFNLEAPKPVSLANKYSDLREAYGVAETEKILNDLTTLQDEAYARLRQRGQLERGQAVPLSVIGGRLSEVEVQAREEIDFIGRQISSITQRLQTANNLIQTQIQLTAQDYQTAKAWYDTQFSQNMELYKQFKSEQQYDAEVKKEEERYEQNTARANLQIYTDMIKTGQLTYERMTAAQKADVAKLEVQAGLGQGFLKSIRIAPSETIKSITTRTLNGKQYADVLKIDANGKLTVESKLIGSVDVSSSGGSGGSGGSGSGRDRRNYWTQTEYSKARSALQQIDHNRDKLLSRQEYEAFYDQVLGLTGNNTEVAAQLAEYLLIGYDEWKPLKQATRDTGGSVGRKAVDIARKFLGR